MTKPSTQLLSRSFLLALLIGAGALMSGCNVVGWLGDPLRGIKQKESVGAQYNGLHNHSIAVLVSADDHTLFHHPDVQVKLARAMAKSLTAGLESVKVIDPEQVWQFQSRNPYWITLPYSDLVSRLEVERILFVDLVEYRTHEPGNTQVWQGLVVANIGVAEAQSANPNSLVYASTVQAVFPPNRPVGILDSDARTIELGMLQQFTQSVTNLFRTHQVVSP